MTPVHKHGLTGVLSDVATFLVGLEEQHHAAGWDNTPATLYTVCRDPEGRAGVDGYVWHPTPLGEEGIHPRLELAGIADALERPEAASWLTTPEGQETFHDNYPFPPVAHILVSEGWSHTSTDLADMPGSVEVRLATAWVGDERLVLRRARGREVTIERMTGKPPGAMELALHRLDVAARNLFHGSAQ